MDAAENVDFAIIGDAEKLQEKLEGTSYGKRIHFLGYCRDLLGTYRALHLYLNPRRLGGGWSSAMALMAGLPVVTLPACDDPFRQPQAAADGPQSGGRGPGSGLHLDAGLLEGLPTFLYFCKIIITI